MHGHICICGLHVHLPMTQCRRNLGCASIPMQQPLVTCVASETIHQTAHAAAVKPLLAEYAAAAIWKGHGPLE